jgi:hypothetical protein
MVTELAIWAAAVAVISQTAAVATVSTMMAASKAMKRRAFRSTPIIGRQTWLWSSAIIEAAVSYQTYK